MDWLQQLFELILLPLLAAATSFLIYWINTKIQEMKKKTDNELAQQYLDMLNDTIARAVLTTTQTYVETLKKEGRFDAEAQKIAFEKTFSAVKSVLTDEAIKYIETAVGDLTTYITNSIEYQVKLNKEGLY